MIASSQIKDHQVHCPVSGRSGCVGKANPFISWDKCMPELHLVVHAEYIGFEISACPSAATAERTNMCGAWLWIISHLKISDILCGNCSYLCMGHQGLLTPLTRSSLTAVRSLGSWFRCRAPQRIRNKSDQMKPMYVWTFSSLPLSII